MDGAWLRSVKPTQAAIDGAIDIQFKNEKKTHFKGHLAARVALQVMVFVPKESRWCLPV